MLAIALRFLTQDELRENYLPLLERYFQVRQGHWALQPGRQRPRKRTLCQMSPCDVLFLAVT